MHIRFKCEGQGPFSNLGQRGRAMLQICYELEERIFRASDEELEGLFSSALMEVMHFQIHRKDGMDVTNKVLLLFLCCR